MDDLAGRPDPRHVTSFGRLIREQREKRGMSLDAVVAAAKAAGYTMSKARVHQLETEAVPTWPRPEILKGLSAALVIPERVLTAAMIESMGLALPQMPSTDWQMIAAKSEALTPAGKRRLMKQIETLIDLNDEESDE